MCMMFLLQHNSGTPENGYLWNRVSPQLSSPNQPYSLREALAQAQSSRIGATTRALRESLHPVLRQKLVNNLVSNYCFPEFYLFLVVLKDLERITINKGQWRRYMNQMGVN